MYMRPRDTTRVNTFDWTLRQRLVISEIHGRKLGCWLSHSGNVHPDLSPKRPMFSVSVLVHTTPCRMLRLYMHRWVVGPMLVYCWASVVDGGPTVNQRWANVPCLHVDENLWKIAFAFWLSLDLTYALSDVQIISQLTRDVDPMRWAPSSTLV